jgi:hypothetical protein
MLLSTLILSKGIDIVLITNLSAGHLLKNKFNKFIFNN